MSRELYSEIDSLLAKTELKRRHSLFQLEYFVIGKEVNIQAKLQKCLIELETRRETMENYYLAIEEAQDDVELYEIQIEKVRREKLSDELDIRAQEIAGRKLERKKAALEKSLESLKEKLLEAGEEAELFLCSYKELAKLESPKPFDDLETNAIIWNEKLTRELRLQLMLQKPFDMETIKTILAMPNESQCKKEVLGILSQIENKALEAKVELKLEDDG